MIRLSLLGDHRPRRQIGGNNLRHLDLDVGMLHQDVPQAEGDVAGRQEPGRHLVQQRLELLIVVLVDQRDADLRMRCQFAGAVQSGKTTANDDDMLHWSGSLSQARNTVSGETHASLHFTGDWAFGTTAKNTSSNRRKIRLERHVNLATETGCVCNLIEP